MKYEKTCSAPLQQGPQAARSISISEFDYDLPQHRIAEHPLEQRDSCKLLRIGPGSELSEHVFSDLPSLLSPDTLLVCNNTRVINARLRMRKGGETGASIEIFCLEPVMPADYAECFSGTGPCRWLCFVGNSKRWKDAPLQMQLSCGGRAVTLTAVRIEKAGNASVVEFSWEAADGGEPLAFASVIEAAGEIPIPPYLNRPTQEADSRDYQTVYSRIKGSVAAPTAGLHFTDALLSRLAAMGIERRELTLHVGAGTFQPVKDDDVALHTMHSEFMVVPLALIEELALEARPVCAVGTTSVRTLESLYHIGCLMRQGRWQGEVPQWYPYEADHPRLSVAEALGEVAAYLRRSGMQSLAASTRIIISPGYEYRIVKSMITNFHQPKSTLLLLVSAFVGDAWRSAYDYALGHGFRFLSYGDACLLTPQA